MKIDVSELVKIQDQIKDANSKIIEQYEILRHIYNCLEEIVFPIEDGVDSLGESLEALGEAIEHLGIPNLRNFPKFKEDN